MKKSVRKKFINTVGGFVVLLVIAAGLVLNFSNMSGSQEVEAAELISENYYTYAPDAYEKSRAEGDVVVLNFYADWCPTCNAFEPTLKSVLEQMSVEAGKGKVTAYRVNFGDNEQTQSGKQLAKDFGVTTQTTTIVLNPDGKVFKTYFTAVPEDELKQTILVAAVS